MEIIYKIKILIYWWVYKMIHYKSMIKLEEKYDILTTMDINKNIIFIKNEN
jgi:hypothetical protein